MDDIWYDNVEPLLEALKQLGIDPIEWAGDHDFGPFFRDGTRELVDELTGLEPDQIHFACGYLQATANLTNKTWVQQIEDYVDRQMIDG